MTNYSPLKIRIENSDTLQIYFSYTNKTTIDDLIEFIAYNFPEKNICPCYKLYGTYENRDPMEMEGNWTFNNCLNKYSNFVLKKPENNKCQCDKFIKANYTKSKLHIIQNLTKERSVTDFQIDQNTGIIKGNINSLLNRDMKFNDFYDIIIDIKSIKDICQGWEIKMSERAEKNYQELKKDKVIKIGVIGNSNKGKSFLLSKISEIKLPSGTSIRTEGLSVKYPENLEKYKDRKIVLLDSAGLETPVLDEDNIGENKEKDLFKEKSREKLITELFLQNYIINNSDILIIVVGIMTYSEQKLLNKIKIQLKNAKKNKRIFVVHNLMTYTSMDQVNEYIDTVLKKSMTFKIEEGHKISVSTSKENGLYFVEKNDDSNNQILIDHYIMANEGSEAGDFCNEFTKNQLTRFFITAKDEPFDVIETIKERFIDMSKEMFEKTEEIKLENFDEKDAKKIKLNKPSNLTLKKCLIDELGFSNLRTNGFMPLYNYYRKDDKLKVRIEVPGNCDFSSNIIHSGEYIHIIIEGTKKKDKEPANLKENIYNSREIGDFTLDIPLKASEFYLKNEKPEIKDAKGVFIMTYTIEKNNIKFRQIEEDI